MPIGVYVRTPKPPKSAEEVAAWFWAKVSKSDECWEWQGLLNVHGYGRVAFSASNQTSAHRFSWRLEHGPIPKGKVICHRCDNRRCVRPDHLFIGTQRDNLLDASRKRRLPNQLKTHCSNGHPFSGDNLVPRYGRAGRHCLICRRASIQKSNRIRRAKGLR